MLRANPIGPPGTQLVQREPRSAISGKAARRGIAGANRSEPETMSAFTNARVARLSRRGVLSTSLVVGLAPAAVAQQASPDAAQFIRDLGRQAIDLARQPAERSSDAETLTALLDQAADIDLVARLVLGRHWRSASGTQRSRYLELFRGYVLAGLVRRLGGAQGVDRVEVTGSRRARGGDSMVATLLSLGNGSKPASVEWRVRETDAGLRVIDVVAEGISLVVTNRNEFSAIIGQCGMDGLLRQLEEWDAEAPEKRPAA